MTAYELGEHGVPHTVIADNAGGHLMQHGRVDLVIVGADRVAANGDTANKIGTYLKALAAHDTGVPFYVALPSSTIDWSLADGSGIPIEERNPDEVRFIDGLGPRSGAGAARAGNKPRAEPGVRRDPGPAGDRVHHRARGRPHQPHEMTDEKGYIQFRCEWEPADASGGARRPHRVARPVAPTRADRRLPQRRRLREHLLPKPGFCFGNRVS